MTRPPETASPGREVALVGGAWYDGVGGNLTSSVALEEALTSCGFRVKRFGYRRNWWPFGSMATETAEGLELHTRPVVNHGEGVLHRGVMKRWMSRVRPRVVWVLNSRYASALPVNVPYVLWEPTTWTDERRAVRDGMTMSGQRPGRGYRLHSLLRPIDRIAERGVYARAAIVAAMSASTERQILAETLAPRERLTVLPHPPTRTFEHIAHSFATPALPDRDFIAVGRWADPRKGATLLIDAAAKLQMQGERSKWTLVGGGADRVAARMRDHEIDVEVVAASGDVAMVAALRRHRFAVIAALQEGFGITGVEAMHCGIPVVSTRCGGPEDFVHDGDNGLLSAIDSDSLAAVLLRAMRLPEAARQRLADAALADARRTYSTDYFNRRVCAITSQVFGAVPRDAADAQSVQAAGASRS